MTLRLSTLLFLLVQSHVNAWGMDGHYIVAAIAERIVSDRVIAGVNETLGRGQDMISVACWADQASHSAEYRWTAPLHFVDTPTKQCKMDYARDCPNDFCVIGAIYNYTNRATSETESRTGREFAMKLVIHFLGDVHQPLHVGFRGDRGGNQIHVTTDFAPPGPRHKVESKLHQVWDSGIITQDEFELRVARRREHRKIPPHRPYEHKYEERWHELLEHLWTKLSKGGEFAKHREEWLKPCRTNGLLECTKTMAEESLAVACTAAYHDEYRRWIEDGDVLDRDYFLTRNPLMEEQLAKGGVRLAWVLQQMFGSHRHRHHRHHPKKEPHMPKTGEEVVVEYV